MKKFTREERRTWIERGKTVAIVFLCFCCVSLFFAVMDFYKGQVSIGSFFWGTENQTVPSESHQLNSKNVLNTYWELNEPELVMACSVNDRDRILHSDDDFDEVAENINTIMRDVYFQKEESFSVGNTEEWEKTVENNAIYVRYAHPQISKFGAQFYEVSGSNFEKNVTSYSEVLVAPDLSVNGKTTVFVKDVDKEIVKISLMVDSTVLKSAIRNRINDEGFDFAFAYELNLDSNSLNEKDGAAVSLEHMFMIPAEPIYFNDVIVTTPRVYKSGINFEDSTRVATSLINLFGYNPNTIRQYANGDGALIFVSETGSVTMHPEGRIEYKALGENEGIVFDAQSKDNKAAYSIISGVADIVNRTISICGVNEEKNDAEFRISKIEETGNVQSSIELDYFVEGIKVRFGKEAAVIAVIKNGALTELKILVKAIEKTDKKTDCGDVFAAVDSFYKKNAEKNRDLMGKPVYIYNEEDKRTSAVWEIQGGR